jgi:hypothetical protein
VRGAQPGRCRREPACDLAIDRPDRAVRQGHFIETPHPGQLSLLPFSRGIGALLALSGDLHLFRHHANLRGFNSRPRGPSAMTGGRKQRSIYYARFRQKCLGNPEAAEYRANAALLYLAEIQSLPHQRRCAARGQPLVPFNFGSPEDRIGKCGRARAARKQAIPKARGRSGQP